MNALTMRIVRGAGGMARHVPDWSAQPAPIGRKRKPRVAPDPIRTNGESAAEQLRLLVERAERIEEEIAALQDDRRDIFAEAKSRGFSDKAIKAIIALRKKDRDALLEEETILELYRQHLGLL